MAATPAVQASRRLGAEVKALGFTIVNVTEIEGCTTIDAGPDAALDCARQGNPGAAPGHSTAEAVHGLLNCLGPSPGRANMIGHGTEGIITTGAGQSGNDSNSYIGLLNQRDWQPDVRRLNTQIHRLSLWACYVGAGEKGAQFLHNVARVVGSVVAGPNGLVCCEHGTLYLESDSTWQVATPSHRPEPIPIAAVAVAEVVSRMTLREGEGWAMVSVGQVAALRYERLSREPNQDLAPVVLTGNEAQRLVGMVDFSTPVALPGHPLALVTGRILITLETGGETGTEAPGRREFVILGDRLLQDVYDSSVYYRASETFARSLASLR